ncbi:MAG: UDP-N-acetylglucosamine 2-epimerase, partial [Desulfovibrionaceae bacterium]
MKQYTICAVTGTRAEYGHLHWLLRAIQDEPALRLRLVVTGMHLSPEFGLTYRDIEADGFPIDARVESVVSSDTPVGVAMSMGLGVMGFGQALDRLRPDLLLVDGDRYEIVAAAQAALFARIPVAHVGGGDVTEGSLDDALRHCLTKLSHLHFPSNELARRRILQMGEAEDRVFNLGSPGIDYILHLDRLDRPALERRLGLTLRPRNILVT